MCVSVCVWKQKSLIIACLQGLSYISDPQPQSSMLFVCPADLRFTPKSNLSTTLPERSGVISLYSCNQMASQAPKQRLDIRLHINIHEHFSHMFES